MLLSLWKYRFFIFSSIRNELINRFTRSKLGGLWSIINPLVQVAIYALILSNVLSAKLPQTENKYAYAIYLMAGLLAWTLFSEIITRCLNLFIEQANLMKKINFPRVTLPAIVLGSSLLNNLLLLLSTLLVFTLFGYHFSFIMLWLLPLTLLLAGFAISIGMLLGIMNIFLRDIGQIVPIILQITFWFTPIVYPESIIPNKYQHLLNLNPLHPIVNAYQQILVYGLPPAPNKILIIGIFTFALLLFGLYIFRQASAEMVDVL